MKFDVIGKNAPGMLVAVVALWGASCSADKAIEEGTDCDQTCPVGAQVQLAKEASGSCGADGSYSFEGSVSASGECKGSGECQVVCLYPVCGDGKTLVISATEYRCEAEMDPCADAKCPVGAQLSMVTELSGSCENGLFTPDGEGTPTGVCKKKGSCDFVCEYPACGAKQTLVITETEFRCEASADPCAEVTCSGHGTCRIVADAASCDCEEGYVANGVYCDEKEDPEVEVITPATAQVGTVTTFTIVGSYMPNSLVAEVEACDGLSFTLRGESVQTFTCTPKEKGTKSRKVYDQSGGTLLYEDQVTFEVPCEGGCIISGSCMLSGHKNPQNPCETCDPAKNLTTWTFLVGASCDDGVWCNGLDVCDANYGGCKKGEAPCADDGLWCNGEEFCDEPYKTCRKVDNVDARCLSDGFYCNGIEFCDEMADACSVENGNPCPDGVIWCDGSMPCDEGVDGPVCLVRDQSVCSDGDPCNGEEYCDPAVSPYCLDGVPPCPQDDGNKCNGVEICNEVEGNAVCGAVDYACPLDDFDYCNGVDGCEPPEDPQGDYVCTHSGNPCHMQFCVDFPSDEGGNEPTPGGECVDDISLTYAQQGSFFLPAIAHGVGVTPITVGVVGEIPSDPENPLPSEFQGGEAWIMGMPLAGNVYAASVPWATEYDPRPAMIVGLATVGTSVDLAAPGDIDQDGDGTLDEDFWVAAWIRPDGWGGHHSLLSVSGFPLETDAEPEVMTAAGVLSEPLGGRSVALGTGRCYSGAWHAVFAGAATSGQGADLPSQLAFEIISFSYPINGEGAFASFPEPPPNPGWMGFLASDSSRKPTVGPLSTVAWAEQSGTEWCIKVAPPGFLGAPLTGSFADIKGPEAVCGANTTKSNPTGAAPIGGLGLGLLEGSVLDAPGLALVAWAGTDGVWGRVWTPTAWTDAANPVFKLSESTGGRRVGVAQTNRNYDEDGCNCQMQHSAVVVWEEGNGNFRRVFGALVRVRMTLDGGYELEVADQFEIQPADGLGPCYDPDIAPTTTEGCVAITYLRDQGGFTELRLHSYCVPQ